MKKIVVLLVLCAVLVTGCSNSTSINGLNQAARGSLAGTVTDITSNVAIAGANVLLVSVDTPVVKMTSWTDTRGAFSFQNIKVGSYVVVTRATSYLTDSTPVQIDSIATPNLKLPLILKGSGSVGGLSLHVQDVATGQPVVGAMISLNNNTTDTTNATGDFSSEVTAGPYTVKISRAGYVQYSFALYIASGQVESQTVQLTAAPPAPASKLVCLYRFDKTVDESNGNGINATRHGCTYVDDRFGNPESALQFNGTSDYLTIPNVPQLNFGKSSTFTICFWVNCSTQNNDGYILHKATGAGNSMTGFEVLADYYYFTADAGTTYGRASSGNGPSIPQDARWHFVVVGFDRSGSIWFSVDNNNPTTVVSSAMAMQGNINTNAPLLIGGDGTAITSYNGILDDIRIYNGLLSGQEIDGLFHENGW